MSQSILSKSTLSQSVYNIKGLKKSKVRGRIRQVIIVSCRIRQVTFVSCLSTRTGRTRMAEQACNEQLKRSRPVAGAEKVDEEVGEVGEVGEEVGEESV